MRRSGVLVGAGLLACVGAIATATAPACTIAGVCTGSTADYCKPDPATGKPGPDCQGHLVNPYTWESVPPGGTWLRYDGELEWHMVMIDQTGAKLQGRPYDYEVYISATNQPEQGGGSSVEAPGNLAVVHLWCVPSDPDCSKTGPASDPPLIYVRNDTCALYFVRVVIHSEPILQDAGNGDASADGASDAPTDSGGQ